MGKYSSRLKVITCEKSSASSRCRRISSRYTPIGVEPVGSPNTVGTPAELFSRIRLSTTSATCLSPRLRCETSAWGSWCGADIATKRRAWDGEECGEWSRTQKLPYNSAAFGDDGSAQSPIV